LQLVPLLGRFASRGPYLEGSRWLAPQAANGATVIADDAYLLSSIEDPDKQVVGGHQPGFMSTTIPRGSISHPDATALVAFIKSLK
jgi:hypothetical protein